MLKRITAGLVVAGSLAASPLYGTNTYCYTVGAFSACASASITVNAGQTQLSIAIQNLSNNTGSTVYTLTGFGFYYLSPPSYTGTLALTSTNTPATWWANGPNGQGKSLTSPGPLPLPSGFTSFNFLGGAHAGNSATQGLLGCGPAPRVTTGFSTCASPATFNFALSNTSNFSLANLNFALHGQSWQTGAPPNPPNEQFLCYSTVGRTCVVSSVPEPATMGLLAIGLVGMGGVGLARHRRKQAK